MKNLITLLFLSVLAGGINAQTTDKPNHIKRPALGIHFILDDFNTAQYIRSHSLNAALSNKIPAINKMSPGFGLSFWNGITNHLDYAVNLGGSFLNYPFKDGRTTVSGDKFLMELDATANLKLLPDNYVVVPYATGGAGVSAYSGYFGAYVPLGVGVQISLMEETFIHLQGQYRLGITDNTNYHFYYGIGFLGNIGKPRETPKPKEIVIPAKEVSDRDGDGIPDEEDACPDQAGSKQLNGCPDRDGDGVPDKDDKCPDVKGLAKYLGCPPPDRDGDGIYDEDDKCPDVPGVARFQGCPIPDTDGDGVNDEIDQCPLQAGPASNHGCPVIKKEVVEKVETVAKNIFFATGSAKFTGKTHLSLDELVKVLKEDQKLKLEIEGHTDNTGSAAVNTKLSQARADAVKKYLVSKGIDAARLSSHGYGPDQPIADNKTAAGRALNRRVEMKLSM